MALMAGGGYFIYRNYQAEALAFLGQSQPNLPAPNLSSLGSLWQQADVKVAEGIRAAGQGEWSSLVPKASISANLSTDTHRLSEAYVNGGVAGVSKELFNQAQVGVGGVTTNAWDEARYQYCLGVVESRQSKEAP